ncbi:MAG: ornithine cyclodeaminase [Limnobacter sp.]|uniref:ornithine cyclodeaminase n=1 Tax=Limnobacter sp. TaxID=2003368 RepID=UPI0032EAE499
MNTPFLSAHSAAALISRQGLAHCLRGMRHAIEHDFKRWEQFEKSARLASYSAQGVIEVMPISDRQTYGFKYVNGHPNNHRHELPTVMAFGMLADVKTGLPMFISELTLITALRTAATSVLAAGHLVKPGSRSMALIGNGAQSEFQAVAFHEALGIDRFYLYDTDLSATDRLARHLNELGFHVTRCKSVAQAVARADVITTGTASKTRANVLTMDMLKPGVHINAIGGDCPGKTELHPDVLRHARVCVEYEPQTRIEGDIQQMPSDFPVIQLWEVLTGFALGRTHADQITVFDSVGFALEDFSALRYMHQLAQDHGELEYLSLIPELPDPKNLYGLLPQLEAACSH